MSKWTKLTPVQWHGCYDLSWKDLIVPKAFGHPAKFARGLVERIIDHGLVPLERIHAMLVKETTENDMFSANGTHTKVKARKSFFRRLAEKNGSPPIDFEEIIFVKKP